MEISYLMHINERELTLSHLMLEINRSVGKLGNNIIRIIIYMNYKWHNRVPLQCRVCERYLQMCQKDEPTTLFFASSSRYRLQCQ
jgi:hypothetical protein